MFIKKSKTAKKTKGPTVEKERVLGIITPKQLDASINSLKSTIQWPADWPADEGWPAKAHPDQTTKK